VRGSTLNDVRLELHWAAQLVSSVGTTLALPQPDFGHTTLEWIGAVGWLAGKPVNHPSPFRVALNVERLTLAFLDDAGVGSDEFPLAGKTYAEAESWLAEAIQKKLELPDLPVLKTAEYDIPKHPVAAGAPFAFETPEAFAELSRWFANSATVLEKLRLSEGNASAVRCWPHHFDIAVLISLNPSNIEAGGGPSIGIGMSPGDGSYAEPYFYVSPWPYPSNFEPVPLAGGGHWHQAEWVGAVLTASDLEILETGAHQEVITGAFFDSALVQCRQILGAPES
jgi:hypothetical protein